jgi:hypothetical protein
MTVASLIKLLRKVPQDLEVEVSYAERWASLPVGGPVGGVYTQAPDQWNPRPIVIIEGSG